MSFLRILLITVLAVSSILIAQEQPPKETAMPVTSDTPTVTAGGASFTVPAGWTAETRSNMVVLTPPETDTHLVIVDAHGADAKAAVASAWNAYKPDFKRALKLVTPEPAREGWEERATFNYETSPNERAVVTALAMRAGSNWTVVLLDGTEMTLEKRSSPLGLVLQSLSPKGFSRESFANRKPNPLDAARIEQLKAFVQSGMQQLGIPGVGLSFMDHGKIVYSGGLGVRELGKPQPVDGNTMFMAGSNTKGMTTLLLSELADQKKLTWDEPVVDIYPDFKLGNADTTKKVEVKHLICACTGMPREDLEWIFEFKNATPKSVLDLLGTMQPTSKFGEVYQYSNLMAAAAGYVGAHLAYPDRELGAAYDLAMRKDIFDPLGMKDTTLDFSKALAGDHASPHGSDVDGKPAVASMDFNYCVLPVRPAGAVWTSAADLMKYVQLEANEGKLPNGKQLVSAENLLMRRKPQVAVGEDASYGMGLAINRKYGITVLTHGGGTSGFISNWYLIPSAGIGAVILTNSDAGALLTGPFERRLMELVYDAKPQAEADLAAAAKNHKAEVAKQREQFVVPADPKEAAKLAKHYVSKDLGALDVSENQGVVTFDFGEWKTTVASRKNPDGTVSYIAIDPAKLGFEFVVGEREGRRALIIRDGQHEYAFIETA